MPTQTTAPTIATALLLVLLDLVKPGVARAAEAAPRLLGDWSGTRRGLEDNGIAVSVGYTSELAHNSSGGEREISRYADQFTFGGQFDLERLWGWNGAGFQLIVTKRNGDNLNDEAGLWLYQHVQEIYGRGQTWWLTTLTYHQQLFDGRLQFKLGRLPVGEDFASINCDSQNLTFCGAPPGNIAGAYWGNWPVSQWAGWLKWQIHPKLYFKLGAYQVNPTYLDQRWQTNNAWKPSFPDGTTGALLPFEFGWTPSLRGLPGKYLLGGWYSNAEADDLYYNSDRQPLAIYGGAARQHTAQTGIYLLGRQQLSGSQRKGLTLFANATLTNKEVSAQDRQFALGLEYHGIFNRADDFAGLAVGATHGSKRYAAYAALYNRYAADPDMLLAIADGYEYVTEAFYNWAVLPGLSLRPNLQYVLHPGARSRVGDVFVLGLKTAINF